MCMASSYELESQSPQADIEIICVLYQHHQETIKEKFTYEPKSSTMHSLA
jgi:hypothetical protein